MTKKEEPDYSKMTAEEREAEYKKYLRKKRWITVGLIVAIVVVFVYFVVLSFQAVQQG